MKTRRSGANLEPLPLRSRVLRELLAWTWVLAAFLFINGTIGQARVIPSSSMEGTLLVGDHLLMSRLGYDAGLPFTNWHVPLWRAPRRQQVIVFRAPVPGSPDYVKRIIGAPGDTVEIRDGVVWVNGASLPEPYLQTPSNPGEQFGPVEVPASNYFVLGDNRSNSYDSRYWGFVPRSAIIGTPVIVYMSIQAHVDDAWEPGHLHERFLAYLNATVHPNLVRWKRLFKML